MASISTPACQQAAIPAALNEIYGSVRLANA
jgi:hypothetical protein